MKIRHILTYLISAIIWEIPPDTKFDINWLFSRVNEMDSSLKLDRLLPADYIMVYRILYNFRKMGIIQKNAIGDVQGFTKIKSTTNKINNK
jgi:hypothetical protein